MYDNRGSIKLETIPPAGWVSPWFNVMVLATTSIVVKGFAFIIRFKDKKLFLSLNC